jgi:hypothetical protein
VKPNHQRFIGSIWSEVRKKKNSFRAKLALSDSSILVIFKEG